MNDMLVKREINNEKFFDKSSNEMLIKAKLFVDYEMNKEESSNNYFLSNSGELEYKIIIGKIFDFSF